MIPLQFLALVTLFAAETPAPAVDPVAATLLEMSRPDWIQRELRGTPPSSMASTSTQSYAPPPPPQPTSYVQGLLGVTELRVKDVNLDSGDTFNSSDTAEMPLIGGAVQRPLQGDKLRLGVEGGFLLGWEGNIESVVLGGGTVVIAADNDLFLMEGFAGLYADLMLGDKVRVYGGAGGLLDYAHMDLSYDSGFGYANTSADGFGWGVYTRLGFDLPLRSGMRLGFCWRWFDTDIDMGGEIDDIELDGMQYMLTFTKSM